MLAKLLDCETKEIPKIVALVLLIRVLDDTRHRKVTDSLNWEHQIIQD